jgi:hypothetical protein
MLTRSIAGTSASVQRAGLIPGSHPGQAGRIRRCVKSANDATRGFRLPAGRQAGGRARADLEKE